VILVLVSVLALTVLVSRPYSDLIEGVLEATVLVLEIGLAVLALIISFEDEEGNRATLGFAMVVMAFVALVLSLCVALWADIYPLSVQLIAHLKHGYLKKFRPDQYRGGDGDDFDMWYSSDSDVDEELAKRMELEDAVLQEMAVDAGLGLDSTADLLDSDDNIVGLEKDDGGVMDDIAVAGASAKERKPSGKTVGFADGSKDSVDVHFASSDSIGMAKSVSKPDMYRSVSLKAGGSQPVDMDAAFGDDIERVATETHPKVDLGARVPTGKTSKSAESGLSEDEGNVRKNASKGSLMSKPSAGRLLHASESKSSLAIARSISEKDPRLEVSSHLAGMSAGAELLPSSQRKSIKELEAEAKKMQRSRSSKASVPKKASSSELATKKSVGFFGNATQ